MIGTRLGPYEILEQLGAGGMGEVWLAQDTRLGRKVAIKVLPPQFATDPERLSRFEQEARAAAALNHPHIAAVFDIGAQGDGTSRIQYMVQEYLQGEPMRALLDRGRLPLRRVLELGAEIAEALAAAHAAGIVHRDIKPENVFVTQQGHAKVLDFGLAKLTEVGRATSGSASMSPTVLGTQAGVVMGTAGYMAPEQITGEAVDARADVFAFGCLLYEAVSGQRAFAGKNLPEVLHRLANEEPSDLAQIDAALPGELRRIARKCLAKDPARRYQGAADLALDIRGLLADVEAGRASVAAAPAAVSPARALTTVALMLVGAIAGAVAWQVIGGRGTAAPARGLHAPLREVPGLDNEEHTPMALSPDGRYLAFATGRGRPASLWNLSYPGAAREMPGTEGARVPFFSLDGQWLTFLGTDRRLYRVPTAGGSAQPVSDPIGGEFGAAFWRDNGDIVFMSNFSDPVMLLPAGGTPRPLIAIDREAGEIGQASASFLPDGDHIAYSYWDDRWRIGVRSLSGGARVDLTEGFAPRYVPTGHLVWVLNRSLMAATFDPRTFALGEPLQLVTVIGSDAGWGRSGYDFSDDGTLVYLEAPADRNTAVVRIDASGNTTVLRQGDRELRTIRASPTEDRLAFDVPTADGDMQIWAYDMLRDDLVPIGQGAGWDQNPAFSADGRRLIWTSERLGSGDLFTRPSDGTGVETELIISDTYKNEPAWSPTGGIAATHEGRFGAGSKDIVAYDPDEPGRFEPLLATPADETSAAFSPDGRLLAYESTRSGRNEIYVTGYPGGLAELEWKVSTGGGENPRWSRDGRRLYFMDGAGSVWRAEVQSTSPFRTDEPTQFTAVPVRDFDVARDGESIIAIQALPPPRPHLVRNWFAELERLLPPR